MGEEYSFDQGTFTIPRLVTDGTSVWQEEESAEHYTNNSNTTLSDNINESYMTADEAGDNTQYFSVLETTSETILNDISLDVSRVGTDYTIGNEENIAEAQGDTNNQDVVLFRVDGSDELYGIQVAQDEEGNLQKYQFQVRQNADGQFETVPETIQVMPYNADEAVSKTSTDNTNIDQQDEDNHDEDLHTEHVFVKQELLNQDSPKSTEEQEQEVMEEIEEVDEDNLIEIHHEDTKEGILRNALQAYQAYKEHFMSESIKGEMEQEEFVEGNVVLKKEAEELAAYQRLYFNEDSNIMESEGHFEENTTDPKCHSLNEETAQEDEDHQQIIASNLEKYFSDPPEDDESVASHNTDYINEDHVEEHESDDGIDEIHITTDDNLQYEHIILDNHGIFKPKILHVDPHLEQMTDTTLKNINRIVNNNKSPALMVIKSVEKENVVAKTFQLTKKANPRSILKSSVIESKPEFDRRFAKGKVAVQARQFQNYISQTKILEAPVRQQRLPRKQKIKPLIRSGEEIVVQEVVVSSNGFIETREDGVLRERKPLVPTEWVQLTDSDDGDSSKKRRRRTKKHVQIEIVISDSDEDDVQFQPEEITRLQHQCTKCPKSFPSIGSLQSHMQFHNYSESNEKSVDVEIASKYQCTQCNESFENNALLNVHITTHEDANPKLGCTICKKNFSEKEQLFAHKRSHVKDQMFKTTTLIHVSPKKSRVLPGIPKVVLNKYKCSECNEIFKNNILLNKHTLLHKNNAGNFKCNVCKKVFSDKVLWIKHKSTHVDANKTSDVDQTNTLKCKDCNKSFATAMLLSSHSKSHKHYVCNNCSASFLSKFILDNHVLRSCVKSPVRKKLSPKKSLIVPPRAVSRISTMGTTAGTSKPQKTTLINVKCDTCDLFFTSHTNLLRHKVQSHGLNTPDKTVGKEIRRNTLYRQRAEHSGIPAAKKLKNVFATLRSKLNE